MRFLFRLIVLALAAFGAKALYDWLAPAARTCSAPGRLRHAARPRRLAR